MSWVMGDAPSVDSACRTVTKREGPTRLGWRAGPPTLADAGTLVLCAVLGAGRGRGMSVLETKLERATGGLQESRLPSLLGPS